jgi:hypothetical protein
MLFGPDRRLRRSRRGVRRAAAASRGRRPSGRRRPCQRVDAGRVALTSPPRRGPACRSRAAPRSAPAGPRSARRSPPAGRRTGAAPPGAGSGHALGKISSRLFGMARCACRPCCTGIRRSRPPHTIMVGVSTMTGSLSVALIVWPAGSTTVRKVARKARRGPLGRIRKVDVQGVQRRSVHRVVVVHRRGAKREPAVASVAAARARRLLGV